MTESLSVRETIKHGKVTALSARAGRRVSKRTVVIGSVTVTIAAGASSTVTVPLNARGRRLLAARHRLRAKLTVTEGGKLLQSSTIVLTAPRHRKRH